MKTIQEFKTKLPLCLACDKKYPCTKHKFEMNKFAKKIKEENCKREALETAEQVKSWNKHDVEGYEINPYLLCIISALLGMVVAIISMHSTVMSVLEACK